MEKSDDIKGPSVIDRAKDEVVAVTGTVHDALHSVKKETEEKAEKLKGGLKHLLHKGPQFYGKVKEEIKVHIFEKNGRVIPHRSASGFNDVLSGKSIIGEDNGETFSPVETSIPVQVLDTKQEGALDTKKEGENNFVAFFARIFEKCCEPFNKKKD